jgi:hypothetical protein
MCHDERGSKDIFRPHPEVFACGRCAFFIPWTARVNIFSGERESGLRDEHVHMWVAHGDAIAARERRREYILRAKKNELTITTCATRNRFFLFFTYPHACMRAQQPKKLVFQNVKKLFN